MTDMIPFNNDKGSDAGKAQLRVALVIGLNFKANKWELSYKEFPGTTGDTAIIYAGHKEDARSKFNSIVEKMKDSGFWLLTKHEIYITACYAMFEWRISSNELFDVTNKFNLDGTRREDV